MIMEEPKNPFVEAKIVQVDADPEAYHRSSPIADRGKPEFMMSSHSLRLFITNPSKWVRGFEQKESDSTEWGGVHDTIFTQSPERFKARYAVQDETYPAGPQHERVKSGELKEGDPLPWHASATYCKNWAKANKDKKIISHAVHQEVLAARKRVFDGHDYFQEYLACSQRQMFVVATYRDPETKIEVPWKCLIDLVPDKKHKQFGKSIGDLKSSACAAPDAWAKTVNEFGYDIQGSSYLLAYRKAVEADTEDDRQDFRHLVQENEFPYEYQGYFLEQGWIQIGAGKLVSGLAKYCQCLKKREWPGYSLEGKLVLDGFGACQMLSWMMKP